jgi:hypothetical protein
MDNLSLKEKTRRTLKFLSGTLRLSFLIISLYLYLKNRIVSKPIKFGARNGLLKRISEQAKVENHIKSDKR